MRSISGHLALGILMLTAGLAEAQQGPAQTSGTLQGNTFQQRGGPPAGPALPVTRPLFSLFGVPVVLNTPVAAPYCNCATQSYAGQPAGGRNTPLVPSLSDSWLSSR